MGSDLTVPAFQDLRACPAKAARGVAKAWSRISDIGGDMLSPKKFRASDPATPKEHMFYLMRTHRKHFTSFGAGRDHINVVFRSLIGSSQISCAQDFLSGQNYKICNDQARENIIFM